RCWRGASSAWRRSHRRRRAVRPRRTDSKTSKEATVFAKDRSANRPISQSIRPQTITYQAPSGGRRHQIEIPQRFPDWTLPLGPLLSGPSRGAGPPIRRFLPADSGLEPVTIFPGIGLVTLAGFDYRRPQTLKPYQEAGVMFAVRYRPMVSLPAVPLFRPEW